ncbi:MAG: hypothetical protein HY901_02805 [Deltaproteobacteria bacterium]|nr:hypothetical protein [Deltaproteobacteria bacterium]
MRWAALAMAGAMGLAAAAWAVGLSWLSPVWAAYIAALTLGLSLLLAGAWASLRARAASHAEPASPPAPEERERAAG